MGKSGRVSRFPKTPAVAPVVSPLRVFARLVQLALPWAAQCLFLRK